MKYPNCVWISESSPHQDDIASTVHRVIQKTILERLGRDDLKQSCLTYEQHHSPGAFCTAAGPLPPPSCITSKQPGLAPGMHRLLNQTIAVLLTLTQLKPGQRRVQRIAKSRYGE